MTQHDDLCARLDEQTVTISEAMRQRALAAAAIRELEAERDAAQHLFAQQDRHRDELLAENDALRERAEKAEAELERERVRLAGCGVIAGCNTNESLATQMPSADDYGYSASLTNVQRCVMREIRERERAERAEAERDAYRDAATARDRNEDALRAERDALRALLEEARDYVDAEVKAKEAAHGDRIKYKRAGDIDLRDRIDAALRGAE